MRYHMYYYKINYIIIHLCKYQFKVYLFTQFNLIILTYY